MLLGMGLFGRRRQRRGGAGRRGQRLYLHVGVPKSGTTFLQTLLAENRDRLREHGYLYPFVRPEGMFHAAAELRGQQARWGLDPAVVDGTWEQLIAKVRAFPGTGVVSHELLAGARDAQLDRVAETTRDLELHLVVTARDLGRQATAHWQEEVKNGRTWSFAEFARELFEPGQSEAVDDGFWRMQDLPVILDAWSPVVPPARQHVVVVPPAGSRPAVLWSRYADALGLDAGVLDPAGVRLRNESLGTAQVALLRQVLQSLDGRLGQPAYAHVVKRFFAQRLLAGIDGPRPTPPAPLVARLRMVASGWVQELGGRELHVYGDLADLLPQNPPNGARHPDDVHPEELLHGVPDALAALLEEVAALRRASPEAPGPPA